jgi:hypothetical protein
MRLILTAIVCSLLTVGGFFVYKQYQRSEMKQDARAHVMSMVQRNSQDVGADARARVDELVGSFLDEMFRRHYESGGLTKPAEFDEVNFSRELFAKIYEETRGTGVSEETKDFAALLFAQSRPLQQGSLGGVGGGRLPEDTPEDDVPGEDDGAGG